MEGNTWPLVAMEYIFQIYKNKLIETFFQRIPTTFRRFPKIRQKLSEDQTEDSNLRILPKNFEGSRKCFYQNKFKYSLRDKLDISEITNIFTSENMENKPLESTQNYGKKRKRFW